MDCSKCSLKMTLSDDFLERGVSGDGMSVGGGMRTAPSLDTNDAITKSPNCLTRARQEALLNTGLLRFNSNQFCMPKLFLVVEHRNHLWRDLDESGGFADIFSRSPLMYLGKLRFKAGNCLCNLIRIG